MRSFTVTRSFRAQINSVASIIKPKGITTNAGPGKTIMKVKTGETIFKKGTAADTFFYIQSGRVKIMAYSTSQREAIVAIMTKSSLLANGAMNGLKIHTTSAIALEPCVLTAITKPAMLDFMTKSTDLVLFVMKYLASHVHGMTDDKIDMLFNNLEKRTIRQLCELSRYTEEDENGFKMLPTRITQKVLAELLGSAQSAVNPILKKLTRLGWIIRRAGKTYVHINLLTTALDEKPMSGKKRVKKT